MTPGGVRGRDPRLAGALAVLAGAIAAGLILWLAGSWQIAAGFLAAGILLAAAALLWRRSSGDGGEAAPPDWSVTLAMAETVNGAVAVTDRGGHLICANDRYRERFGGYPTPPGVNTDASLVAALTSAGRAAWRDGEAVSTEAGVVVRRVGADQDTLLWRFDPETPVERAPSSALPPAIGEALARAGIMAAVVDAGATIISANSLLEVRAGAAAGVSFVDIVDLSGGQVRLTQPGAPTMPLRLTELPLGDEADAPLLALLTEEEASAPPGDATAALMAALPFGIALVDREGRFVTMNPAFAATVGTDPADPPLYPGDLVVKEDKAALADAVRRMAGMTAQPSTQVVVRLARHPEEPVQLSLSGARGLGGAAVLMGLRDNGEESRLKREVAQATKMQAVGQLAGGVAHDFNNILTAIIGHCDLMLMRHSPGDSDYDDIGQVKINAIRAASLTRQLLAFSRQQTLRPQILQLADVVSEVSNLLKRLLGETVVLEVKHGRDLGAVRADPGQMEQVVVNLAVNARDAMLGKGGSGGKLTIQTRSVPIAEIRQRGTDIMPAGDYTALEISDTGTGIPIDVLPKIFEPFFTTKEVGKGTGLGLSTVYGIVKQSGGYIFADSRPGQGATFTIYFPVHAKGEESAPVKPARAARMADTWGTGTILLVEDEGMVRAVAERALARQGYTVLAAENGDAALELMEGVDRPTLVVSDVMMPVMDGPTLARALRKTWPNVPILFMSGYAEEQLRRSINIDNIAFLPKPFSVQQLAEAARDLLAAQET